MHEDISPVMPLVTYFVVSYLTAKLYMNVFGLAVDASLQCYLCCEELKITGEFVPKDLKNFVEKNVGSKGIVPEAAKDEEPKGESNPKHEEPKGESN